jgi:hypothetical protein
MSNELPKQITEVLMRQAALLREMADSIDKLISKLDVGVVNTEGVRAPRKQAMKSAGAFKAAGLSGRAASLLAWRGFTSHVQISENAIRDIPGMGPHYIAEIMRWKEQQEQS